MVNNQGLAPKFNQTKAAFLNAVQQKHKLPSMESSRQT
jgi:hypothetical protein